MTDSEFFDIMKRHPELIDDIFDIWGQANLGLLFGGLEIQDAEITEEECINYIRCACEFMAVQSELVKLQLPLTYKIKYHGKNIPLELYDVRRFDYDYSRSKSLIIPSVSLRFQIPGISPIDKSAGNNYGVVVDYMLVPISDAEKTGDFVHLIGNFFLDGSNFTQIDTTTEISGMDVSYCLKNIEKLLQMSDNLDLN